MQRTYLLMFLTMFVSIAHTAFFDAQPKALVVTKDTLHPIAKRGGWSFVYTPKNQPVFPGFQRATKLIQFTFSASTDLIETSHASVHINMGKNPYGIQISRGIVIGNMQNRLQGCHVPTVQIETFITGALHYHYGACVQIFPQRRYTITLGVAKDWFTYIVQDQLGKTVVQDAVNATNTWGEEEAITRGLGWLDIPDYNVSEVAFAILPIFPESVLEVSDIRLGFYLND